MMINSKDYDIAQAHINESQRKAAQQRIANGDQLGRLSAFIAKVRDMLPKRAPAPQVESQEAETTPEFQKRYI